MFALVGHRTSHDPTGWVLKPNLAAFSPDGGHSTHFVGGSVAIRYWIAADGIACESPSRGRRLLVKAAIAEGGLETPQVANTFFQHAKTLLAVCWPFEMV